MVRGEAAAVNLPMQVSHCTHCMHLSAGCGITRVPCRCLTSYPEAFTILLLCNLCCTCPGFPPVSVRCCGQSFLTAAAAAGPHHLDASHSHLSSTTDRQEFLLFVCFVLFFFFKFCLVFFFDTYRGETLMWNPTSQPPPLPPALPSDAQFWLRAVTCHDSPSSFFFSLQCVLADVVCHLRSLGKGAGFLRGEVNHSFKHVTTNPQWLEPGFVPTVSRLSLWKIYWCEFEWGKIWFWSLR